MDLVQSVIDGVEVLISLEKRLESGEKVESDIEKIKHK